MKSGILLLALLFGGLACASGQIYGGPIKGTLAPEPQKKAPTTRSLSGLVLTQDDSPISHAIVYLKNTKTLTVKTYIANENGTYLFNGLSPNQDYEIFAESQGSKSATKTLSSFDNRPKATMNLRIEGKKK